jgi:hypothetical protein
VQQKDMIEAALKDTRGRVSGPAGAAIKLEIPRSTLESKIWSSKIGKNRFKVGGVCKVASDIRSGSDARNNSSSTRVRPFTTFFHAKASSSAYRASGISPIVEPLASLRQAKLLRFNILSLDAGLHSLYGNFLQTKTMCEFMYQENIYEEAIREERTQIAEELDTLLQTFLSASMQLGLAADSLPSDSPVKPRLDRILQIMDEGTKVGLKRVQSWLSQQPPKRKLESRLYLSGEVTAQEKQIIEAALRECLGRVFGPSGAAAKLGIARATLESKIRSLKINKNRFRPHRGT